RNSFVFFFQAEDGIRDRNVTGVQTCALPILAIFATPESIRTYRLANKLSEAVEVSDRFHIIPLLRAVTFPQAAYVLALSENAVRVVEVSADLPAQELTIPNLPQSAEEVTNRATNKNYTGTGHRHGSQTESYHLPRYLRLIDAA